MCPGFIVTNETRLHVSIGRTRSWLLTIALATDVVLVLIIPSFTKLVSHTTEAERAAANIKRAFFSGWKSISATLCDGIAITPADFVRRWVLAQVRTTSVRPIVAIPRFLRTTSTIGAWLGLGARVIIVSRCRLTGFDAVKRICVDFTDRTFDILALLDRIVKDRGRIDA